MTTFFVEGTPRPQGSKRSVGRGRFIESSEHLPAWRKAIVQAAKKAHPETIEGPVWVESEFVFPRPKRLHGKPTDHLVSGADVDKLQRAVGDALQIAETIQDDRFIVMWKNPRKRYAEDDESPGVHVTVYPASAGLFH